MLDGQDATCSEAAMPSATDPTSKIKDAFPANLDEAISKILESNSLSDLSLKSLRRKLEKELGMSDLSLDAYKKEVKAVFMGIVQSKRAADGEDNSADDGSSSSRPSKRSRVEKQTSHQLQTLTKLVRISRVGPRVYSGLPAGEEERVKALSDALKEAGIKFAGLIPTAAEMAQVKKDAEKARDLDGIDTSNIIQTDSRRRRRTTAVRYTEEQSEEEEEATEGDESDDSYSESEEKEEKHSKAQKENDCDAMNTLEDDEDSESESA